MEQNFDPSEALKIADATRERLAARAGTPPWYAPLYGLGVGGMVASFALPMPLALVGSTLCLLGITGLYSVWTSRSGLSVNGYRKGRTLPITLGLMAVASLLFAVALLLRDVEGYRWVPLACGAVLAIVATLASRAWDRAWRAEIREGLL